MSLIKTFQFFPVAKPPKRALMSFEVFDLDRLKKVLPDDSWIVSSKITGERAQIHVSRGKARIFLDNGEIVDKATLPDVHSALQQIPYTSFVLDAEIIFVDEDGIIRPDIEVTKALRGITPRPEGVAALLVAFDLLSVNGRDLSTRQYRSRVSLLDRFFRGISGLRVVRHEEVPSKDVVSAVQNLSSMEGAVIRAADSSYWEFDRLYKFKWAYDADLVVESVRETDGVHAYTMKTRDGWVLGETKDSALAAEVGDVVRISIQHITRVVKGGVEYFSWYVRSAALAKAGTDLRKADPAPAGVRADTLATIREIWIAMQKLERAQAAVVKNLDANFILQRHWWGDKLTPEAKKDLTPEEIRKLEATFKEHWDIRVQKKGAKVWFGWAFTREPWTASKDNKILTIPKGQQYDPKVVEQVIKERRKQGKELPRQLRKAGPAGTESFGNLRWMGIWKRTVFQPGEPGNPTVQYIAQMEGLDRGPAVLHRREADFVDITFNGHGRMKGRFFIRYVEGVRLDPATGKKIPRKFWVIWKAVNQELTPEEIERIEKRAKKHAPVPIP